MLRGRGEGGAGGRTLSTCFILGPVPAVPQSHHILVPDPGALFHRHLITSDLPSPITQSHHFDPQFQRLQSPPLPTVPFFLFYRTHNRLPKAPCPIGPPAASDGPRPNRSHPIGPHPMPTNLIPKTPVPSVPQSPPMDPRFNGSPIASHGPPPNGSRSHPNGPHPMPRNRIPLPQPSQRSPIIGEPL